MINIINYVCHSFLWFGVIDSSKLGNMSWSKVCKPKKFGGLGVRNLHLWNLGKVAWHISSLIESLWVKWVHEVYTKGGNWAIFNPPLTASWTMRKICQTKDILLPYIQQSEYSNVKENSQDFDGIR